MLSKYRFPLLKLYVYHAEDIFINLNTLFSLLKLYVHVPSFLCLANDFDQIMQKQFIVSILPKDIQSDYDEERNWKQIFSADHNFWKGRRK